LASSFFSISGGRLKEQFVKAYPQARDFVERKHYYDPAGVFENEFYLNYGKPLEQSLPFAR
jgi:hypothetical protein